MGGKNPYHGRRFQMETRTWDSRKRSTLAVFTNWTFIQCTRMNSATEAHKRTSTKQATHWTGYHSQTSCSLFRWHADTTAQLVLSTVTAYHNKHTAIVSSRNYWITLLRKLLSLPSVAMTILGLYCRVFMSLSTFRDSHYSLQQPRQKTNNKYNKRRRTTYAPWRN